MKINNTRPYLRDRSSLGILEAEIEAARASIGRCRSDLAEHVTDAAQCVASIERLEAQIAEIAVSIAKLKEPAAQAGGKSGEWGDIGGGGRLPATAGRLAVGTAGEAMADTSERRLRFAAVDPSINYDIPAALRNSGDVRLIWVNTGDLGLLGTEIPADGR